MYTDRKVIRLIQPVAICVVLVLGALPGVTAACHWACGDVGESGHHHATHNEHSTAAPDPATGSPEATSVVASEQACEHAKISVNAVMTAGLKTFAPAAIDVSEREFVASSQVIVVAADRGTYSPPGARSVPLPLRI